ncbi:MAG TPA: hypothetical protein VKU00_06930 [Chthonomonadaceae bacterium]|nr:hypothetical protein [Chthonomonadaceae bacterium]
MSTSKKSNIPSDKLALYEALVATNPEVERKGASVPYTSHNGHMFTYLDATGTLALKLPKGEREAFLEKYQTKLVEAYGVVQKEFVSVPDTLLANTDELKPYFDISYAYVQSLKPKPKKS